MKKTIDLRGLTCPEPVLRTKKLIDDQSIGTIEVLVDSEVNVQNLTRLANSQKLSVAKANQGDHFKVVLERSSDPETHSHTEHANITNRGTGTIILISRNAFGQGANSDDQDFSSNLLNLFLQTLLQSGHEPRAILMLNSGVKLMDPDGPYIKVLNDLRDKGIEVLACGLCLDYYNLKSQVPVEQVTNMFAICEYLFSADKVISP